MSTHNEMQLAAKSSSILTFVQLTMCLSRVENHVSQLRIAGGAFYRPQVNAWAKSRTPLGLIHHFHQPSNIPLHIKGLIQALLR